jgi:subtilisin family serine protease
MQVCNLSLGTPKTELFRDFYELVDTAYFRRVMLVTAASNEPRQTFPSLYASVISVASHAIPDPLLLYYNPKPPVEFGAHGIDVRVPKLGGSWWTVSGNSFAAPHVTAMIARILGKYPRLTVFQMKTILRALAANAR